MDCQGQRHEEGKSDGGHLQCLLYKPGHRPLFTMLYLDPQSLLEQLRARVADSALLQERIPDPSDRSALGYPWLFHFFLNDDKLPSSFQNLRHNRDA